MKEFLLKEDFKYRSNADRGADGMSMKPAQMKSPVRGSSYGIPEKMGDEQKGNLAVKGAGDANAFAASDINQGSIGNCYFLAALGGIANTNPDLLKKAITANDDGSYTVNLFTRKSAIGRKNKRVDQETGAFARFKKKSFTIRPSFPKSAHGNDSANANSFDSPPHAHGGDQNAKGQTELWVRLIEKAYAMIQGGYEKIGDGGFGEAALETLTGVQYREKVWSQSGKLKDRLIRASENSEPAVLSTGDQDEINTLAPEIAAFASANDIVGGHAYTLISADKNGIKIRNPWGGGASVTEPQLTWTQFEAIFSQASTKGTRG